ncbi:hypothetical protein L0657_03080 [Dyadobacter sp. CY345]|uniref:hypothetical protein n=1 Tax=Dyadobacter sp. CY345 TaxID=2909335 RepID=UPI001F239D38|nr:hypothetical protein [Dyadobacter sp. CY345]MCF2442926.1 hypothetical protein [Dyadobacter sp. CY345]
MDTSLRIFLHIIYLIAGTVIAYFATLFISNLLFPETGCISLKGIFWAIIYIAFFITTGAQIISGKVVTSKMVAKNLLICAVTPYALLAVLSVFS